MNDRKDNCKKRHFRLHLTDQLLSIKFKIFDPNRLNLIFISIFESVVCTDGKSSSLSSSACGHESPIWRSSHLKS